MDGNAVVLGLFQDLRLKVGGDTVILGRHKDRKSEGGNAVIPGQLPVFR